MEVELSEARQESTTIDLTVTNLGGATAADFSGVPESVTFAAGETRKTFTVMATADAVSESGKGVELGFGGLPGGVEAGGVSSATVRIIDVVVPEVSFSVSSYEVMEGEAVEVVVELSQALDHPITIVLTATNLGGATAADFSGVPESVTFAAGETRQTFTVMATADAVSESGEGVELRFSDLPEGVTVSITDAVATVMISNEEVSSVEKRVVEETLKAVAAGAVSNVTANIGARFSVARGGGTVLTLAGRSVSPEAAPSMLGWADRYPHPSWFAENRVEGHSPGRSGRELLGTSAFHVSLGASEKGTQGAGSPQWTVWGRGDVLFFDSDSGNGERYDGDLFAGYLGVDVWLNEHWLAGVAASQTGVAANYGLQGGGGKLKLTMTGAHPYLRFAPSERTELWVILGAGLGEVENRREGGAPRESADVKLYMGSAGFRQLLASGVAGGVDFALLGDLGLGRLDGDAGTGLQAIDGLALETLRARVGVEGSYPQVFASGKRLTPFVELAGRYDGGSGDNETGVEIAGGIAYADPASGLGLEARGNVLALYSQSDYQEYGASVTASLSPGPGGEGLSLALTPRLGTPTRGADMLWRDDLLVSANRRSDPAAASLDARIAYGVSVPALKGILTPFGEVRWYDRDGRRMRAGVKFGKTNSSFGIALDLELFGEQIWTDSTDAEERVNIVGKWRF